MKLTNNKQTGFTIVELLIVVVVIAILAAITIVSYNGITARSNAAAGLAAANTSIKKATLYNTETSGYPTAPSQLTSAAASNSYQLSGVTFAAATTAATPPSTLTFIACGATVGVKIGYYDNVNSTVAYLYAGGATAANCASTTGLTT
ncbi:prepilin-type N-terminal cleavage/methylation domain-containing protein [Candidatus Saccharibacteria bacterium]|nr:prepilin-type N-terminal cleavage/methylation domain-containing protein [Candidatus Saccharibacteria bacterium]